MTVFGSELPVCRDWLESDTGRANNLLAGVRGLKATARSDSFESEQPICLWEWYRLRWPLYHSKIPKDLFNERAQGWLFFWGSTEHKSRKSQIKEMVSGAIYMLKGVVRPAAIFMMGINSIERIDQNQERKKDRKKWRILLDVMNKYQVCCPWSFSGENIDLEPRNLKRRFWLLWLLISRNSSANSFKIADELARYEIPQCDTSFLKSWIVSHSRLAPKILFLSIENETNDKNCWFWNISLNSLNCIPWSFQMCQSTCYAYWIDCAYRDRTFVRFWSCDILIYKLTWKEKIKAQKRKQLFMILWNRTFLSCFSRYHFLTSGSDNLLLGTLLLGFWLLWLIGYSYANYH